MYQNIVVYPPPPIIGGGHRQNLASKTVIFQNGGGGIFRCFGGDTFGRVPPQTIFFAGLLVCRGKSIASPPKLIAFGGKVALSHDCIPPKLGGGDAKNKWFPPQRCREIPSKSERVGGNLCSPPNVGGNFGGDAFSFGGEISCVCPPLLGGK